SIGQSQCPWPGQRLKKWSNKLSISCRKRVSGCSQARAGLRCCVDCACCICVPAPLPLLVLPLVAMAVSPFSVVFEVLHRALVLLGLGARAERAQVAALAGPGIDFAGVQAVLARFQFAYHGFSLLLGRMSRLAQRRLADRARQAGGFVFLVGVPQERLERPVDQALEPVAQADAGGAL